MGWSDLVDVGLGLLGVGGQARMNRENQRFAREQAATSMAFSERMANTAVQRAKADYEAAGFNPALAYDRSAASPTGTTMGAQVSDEISAGISTALQAKQARQALTIAAQQHEENLRNTRADTEVKARTGVLIEKQQEALNIQNRTAAAVQPYQIQMAMLDAILKKASVPRSETLSAAFDTINKLFTRPAGESIDNLQQIMRKYRMPGINNQMRNP